MGKLGDMLIAYLRRREARRAKKTPPTPHDVAIDHALTIRSIHRRPTAVKEIIAWFDMTQRDIPSVGRLNRSLGWLNAKGLIVKEGSSYSLTDEGSETIATSRGETAWETVQALAAIFEPDALEDSLMDTITEQQHHAAYEEYCRDFDEMVKEIEDKGEI